MNLKKLSGLVVAGLLAAGLSSIPPAGASPADPRKDYPRLPRACATPQERIPQQPTTCQLNRFQADRPTIVLWGDSHAWMMIPALRRVVRNHDVNLLAYVMGSCPPMDPGLTRKTRSRAPSCARSNDLALRSVLKLHRGDQPLQVVLAGSWHRYHRALRKGDTKSYVGQQAARFRTAGPRLFRTLGDARVGVDVIGQVATVPTGAPRCRIRNPYACDLSRRKALRQESDIRRWLTRNVRPLAGAAELIDVNTAFCTSRVCRGRQDGDYTFFDDLHLSATQSRKLRSYFLPTLSEVRPAAGRLEEPTPCPYPLIC